MIEYKYGKIKGHDQKKFTENGHTMFESDVLKRLQRLAYLEEKEKNNVVLPAVSGFYILVDGDEVRNGYEYYDYDEAKDWVLIDDLDQPYEHNTKDHYVTRRKI